MKKTVLILAVIAFASCKKVYTCHCESKGATTFSSNTSTIHTTKNDANTTCQQKGIAEGWQTCEVSEAK